MNSSYSRSVSFGEIMEEIATRSSVPSSGVAGGMDGSRSTSRRSIRVTGSPRGHAVCMHERMAAIAIQTPARADRTATSDQRQDRSDLRRLVTIDPLEGSTSMLPPTVAFEWAASSYSAAPLSVLLRSRDTPCLV